MVIKIGMIGFSEGNGHPYSFTAIFNGYNSEKVLSAGWGGIQEYLDKKAPADFYIHNARVTHVWCPDIELSHSIANACNVDCVVENLHDMVGKVDAVIIARDDYESHFEIARIFLEAGLYVFVDKPLTLNLIELKYFENFLQRGQLMSHSGFKHCVELDDARYHYKNNDDIEFANAVVVNDWEKYGIHMIDSLFSLTRSKPISVSAKCSKKICTYIILMDDGSIFNISTIGKIRAVFSIQIIGKNSKFDVDIRDNFRAFKRTMINFCAMIDGKLESEHGADTIASIKTLVAGSMSREQGGNEVFINKLSTEGVK